MLKMVYKLNVKRTYKGTLFLKIPRKAVKTIRKPMPKIYQNILPRFYTLF